MAKVPVVASLVVTLALICAPAAGADPDGTKCGKRGGGASGCQRPGHSSLHTEPKTVPNTPPAGLMRPAWMPGYGVGPAPILD